MHPVIRKYANILYFFQIDIRFIQLLPSCQSALIAKQLRKLKESKHSVMLPKDDLLMYLIALERSSKKNFENVCVFTAKFFLDLFLLESYFDLIFALLVYA